LFCGNMSRWLNSDGTNSGAGFAIIFSESWRIVFFVKTRTRLRVWVVQSNGNEEKDSKHALLFKTKD